MSPVVRGSVASTMFSRFCLAAAALGCIHTSARAAQEADPSLGERLAELGSDTLGSYSLSTAQYREAALLFEAAQRLNPAEPRFPRLRYEASLQAGEVADAIASLVASAKLDTTDLQTQAKLIELYAQRMETAEAKLKYLRDDILPAQAIPAEIRSHAALLAARVLLERGERTAAAAIVGESVRLNPYNFEAQKLRFDLTLREGTPLDRLNGLLAIVRAAPLDVGAVSAVALELDEAGIDESSAWYDAAIGLSLRSHEPPARQILDNYAARLMITGLQRDVRDAETAATRVVQADPNDVNAQLIRASLGRLQGEPSAVRAQQLEARAALVNQLRDAALALGLTPPATQPTTQPGVFIAPPPDPAALADRAAASNDPALKSQFVTAASDLAFFELFFAEDPTAAAPWIEAVRRCEPPQSPLLARLDGWSFLIQKKEPEARQKLSAIDKVDPLASLGLLRLEKDTQVADARARALRSTAHGTVGAMIASDLIPRKTPLVLSTASEAMRQVLLAFPGEILRLIDAPESFYLVRAEPITAVVDYGSPILVRVTVVNLSKFDLPLGLHGAIRPDLWFDATIRGLHAKDYPNIAYDRLAGPLVLRPRQAASRIVRLDQGRLLTTLRTTPYYSIPITATVCTNPITPNGRAIPGAGGQQVTVSNLMEQSPLPTVRQEQRDALIKGLTGAPAAQRPALIEAAALYAGRSPDDTPPEFAAQLHASLDVLLSDPDPTARSWGTFIGILNSSGPLRAAKVSTAAADPYWLVRLLAITASRGSEPLALRALAEKLSSDPDPTVARYAKATLDELDDAAAATSRPTNTPSNAGKP
jgi:tetratricopeptide (TPR) repeat protein